MQKLNLIRKGTTFGFFNKWIDMSGVENTPGITQRCNKEYLSTVLKKLEADLGLIEIASVSVITTGEHKHPLPEGLLESVAETYHASGLPPFCEVMIHHKTPGDITEYITVWVPLAWNGRFMGITGGFTRNHLWLECPMLHTRSNTLAIALRNGFACASTDAGNHDYKMLYAWGVNSTTNQVNRDLIKNFAGRSAHWAAVIGKAITKALHNRAIEYSYIYGSSGGGREAIVEAVNYPEDYDGVWADSPAINWNKLMPAMLWPAVVMNVHNNILPTPKLEAFRQAAISAYGEKQYYSMIERPEFDARDAIGIQTEAGSITEKDAEVMQLMWDGPKDASGHPLCPGIRPGGDTACGLGLHITVEKENGSWDAIPFELAHETTKYWIIGDPTWDWHNMSIEDFWNSAAAWHELYPELDCFDENLTTFFNLGHKLIITHGTDDEVIVVDNSINYFNRVVEHFGARDKVDSFFQLYPVPGDGHGEFNKNGSGPSLATGMIALIEWVEKDIKPLYLLGQHYDLESGEVSNIKEVKPY